MIKLTFYENIQNTIYGYYWIFYLSELFLKAETEDIILRSLDIITIVVPPALPAAMNIGTNYSLKRLKKHKVFSTSVSLISIWGKVKLICFDKVKSIKM